jgi:two-component system LytT family response regulator
MILDDEPLALKQIQTYIQQTPFLTSVAASSDAIEAISLYEKEKPDLLFIDINMPELNGIDFVKSLPAPCLIIFTTAYSQYAIEGFKVDAVDYLLKPIGYPDFFRAANKARKLYELENFSAKQDMDNEYLFVKSEYRLVKLKLSDIKYIEGMREYVRIHLADDIKVITLLSMKALEDRLPKEKFMRVHRSYIVNLEKITVIERQRIVFDKTTYIPVSEQYKETFENFINKNFI